MLTLDAAMWVEVGDLGYIQYFCRSNENADLGCSTVGGGEGEDLGYIQ